MTDDTGYRRSPDFGSVAGCQFRLPFGRRMPVPVTVRLLVPSPDAICRLSFGHLVLVPLPNAGYITDPILVWQNLCKLPGHTHSSNSLVQVTLNSLCSTHRHKDNSFCSTLYMVRSLFPVYVGYLTVLFFSSSFLYFTPT